MDSYAPGRCFCIAPFFMNMQNSNLTPQMETNVFGISKKWQIAIHVFIWVLLYLFPFFLHSSYSRLGQNDFLFSKTFIVFHTNATIFRIIIFYLNIYVLLPKLLFKKKIAAYIVSILAFILVYYLIDKLVLWTLDPIANHNFGGFLFFNMAPFVFVLIASYAFYFISSNSKANERIRILENENLKTELSFLRSQVSPHFMFNVLNNMVALARKKSDLLEPSLHKLSGLLRYMLYETDDDKVPLKKEIEYVSNYIDLQQMRFGKNVQIDTKIDHKGGNYFIEPMLLIPFVENAFKHGVGMVEDAFIFITLRQEGGNLFFEVKNKFIENTEEVKDKTSGIGLTNVRRRLNLLYANSHELNISKENNVYIVSLNLQLH